MKIQFLWDYYKTYLDYYYKNNPVQDSDTYEIVIQRLMDDYFSWIGSLSQSLNEKGYDSEIIVGNDQHTQKAWANENNLNFVKDKSNKGYVELGGSNKFVTFKVWYKSEILNVKQFIKIQINFVELFNYNFKKRKAISLIEGINSKELDRAF